MSNIQRFRNRKEANRSVFRNKAKSPAKSIFRDLLESSMMLLLGTSLIIFLNWLSEEVSWDEILNSTGENFMVGVSSLIEGTINLGSIILVLCAVLTSVLLILGSFWRFLRFVIRLRSFSKHRNIRNMR